MEGKTKLTPNEVCERLGVSLRTLYQWEQDGILIPYRKPSPKGKGRKFYDEEIINEFWNNIEKDRLNRIEKIKKNNEPIKKENSEDSAE